MRAERILAISRDAGFLAVGLGGIVHQQITGRVSELLLAVYVGLLGVPAGINLLQLRPTPPTTAPGESGTTSPPPSSPSSPSVAASGSGLPSAPRAGGEP